MLLHLDVGVKLV